MDKINEVAQTEALLYTTNAPVHMVVLSKDEKMPIDFPKYPFDATIMIKKNQTVVKHMNYSASHDPRWRKLKGAYLQWYPELFEKDDGTLTGTALDIWSIFEDKLQFTITSFVKVNTVPSSHGLLQNRTIDVILPHDVYSTVLSRVSHYSVLYPYVFTNQEHWHIDF